MSLNTVSLHCPTHLWERLGEIDMTSLPPFVLSSSDRQARELVLVERNGMAEAGGTTTGSTWTEDGKRVEKKPESRHKGGERTMAWGQASKGNKGYDFTRLDSNSPGN